MTLRGLIRSKTIVFLALPLLLIACGKKSGAPEEQDGDDSAIRGIRNGTYEPTKFGAVVLLMFGEPVYKGHCTGTLVAPRVVLTAAHCAKGAVDRKVSIRVIFSPDMPPIEDFTKNPGNYGYGVRNVAIHPGYTKGSTGTDFAFLQLEKAVSTIKPIPMTPPGKFPKAGKLVTIVGYGFNELNHPSKRRSGAARVLGYKQGAMDLQIGPSGQSACQGDSGGPALYKGYVVGTVHGGPTIPCADIGTQHVIGYAPIPGPHVRWITDTMRLYCGNPKCGLP